MYLAQFLSSVPGMIIIITLIVWAVLWFLMPFIMSAVNSKLKKANKDALELIKIGNATNVLLRENNKLMEELIKEK